MSDTIAAALIAGALGVLAAIVTTFGLITTARINAGRREAATASADLQRSVDGLRDQHSSLWANQLQLEQAHARVDERLKNVERLIGIAQHERKRHHADQ